MANKSTLICTKHELRFEQFDDWYEKEGGPVPSCYICAHEEKQAIKRQLDEAIRHRDLLLGAIEVKLSLPVGKEGSLGHD